MNCTPIVRQYDKYVTQTYIVGLGVWYIDDAVSGISRYMYENDYYANPQVRNNVRGNDDTGNFITLSLLNNGPLLMQTDLNSYSVNGSQIDFHFMTITGIQFHAETGKYDVTVSTWGGPGQISDFSKLCNEPFSCVSLASFMPIPLGSLISL